MKKHRSPEVKLNPINWAPTYGWPFILSPRSKKHPKPPAPKRWVIFLLIAVIIALACAIAVRM